MQARGPFSKGRQASFGIADADADVDLPVPVLVPVLVPVPVPVPVPVLGRNRSGMNSSGWGKRSLRRWIVCRFTHTMCPSVGCATPSTVTENPGTPCRTVEAGGKSRRTSGEGGKRGCVSDVMKIKGRRIGHTGKERERERKHRQRER